MFEWDFVIITSYWLFRHFQSYFRWCHWVIWQLTSILVVTGWSPVKERASFWHLKAHYMLLWCVDLLSDMIETGRESRGQSWCVLNPPLKRDFLSHSERIFHSAHEQGEKCRECRLFLPDWRTIVGHRLYISQVRHICFKWPPVRKCVVSIK